MRAAFAATIAILVLAGCALGGDRGGHRDGGPGDSGATLHDGGSAMDGGRAPDAGRRDAGASLDGGRRDAGAPRVDSGHPGSLDPELSPADPSGDPCTMPGRETECPFLQVCRFYSATEGRCEGCEPCGNLGDSCTQSSECDILFACFRGQCTNICPLGTFYCGAVEDCLDVGYPGYGVCRP